MGKTVVKTYSPRETQRVARDFARKILSNVPQRDGALVIALRGELGSGKTTFVQGFARGLGIKEKVLSPSFVIVKSYEIPHPISTIQRLYHIDCYRSDSAQDLKAVGWDTIVSNPSFLVLIEWPEHIEKILPSLSISLKFQCTKQHERTISFPLSFTPGIKRKVSPPQQKYVAT